MQELTIWQHLADFFDRLFSGLANTELAFGVSFLEWISITIFATIMIGLLVRFLR